MGKSQRRKGAAGERELAALLTDELGFVVKRKLGAARDGGDDIQIGQFRIECKRQERVQIYPWMEQAQSNSEPGEIPVVMFRTNGKEWLCCFRFTDAVRLMREYL